MAVMWSVHKKMRKSGVWRNRARRRTKEAYRLSTGYWWGDVEQVVGECAVSTVEVAEGAEQAPKGRKIAIDFIYSSKQIESYKKIDNAVKQILTKIGKGC